MLQDPNRLKNTAYAKLPDPEEQNPNEGQETSEASETYANGTPKLSKMSAEGPTSDVGGSKTFDELAGGYSMPSSSPSGYNGPEDGGFTGVPGKLPAQPAATGYTNVGHDGSFNGMNREQWRDAWMSQGAPIPEEKAKP